MPIKSTTISDDVFKSDKDLTVDVVNTYEYSFDSAIDSFIDGFTGPAPFVGSPSSDIITDGYEPRLVFTEDVEVEVFLDGSSTPFHIQTFTFNYYIQRKSSTTVGTDGGTDGGFDGGVDGGTGGSGGQDDGLSTDDGEDVDGGISDPSTDGGTDSGTTNGGTTSGGATGGGDGGLDNETDDTFSVG